MSAEDLKDLHLADLHAKAAEVGINGYRMLSRDELIAEIEAGGKRKRSRWPRRKATPVDAESDTGELAVVDDKDESRDAAEDDAAEQPKPRRRGRRGGRGRGGRDRERLGSDERSDSSEDEETEELTGVLEVTRQRHGFLAIEGSDDDVYVSASQVRRCELSDGDEVTGPVRAPRRGERHRALVRVNLVNGEPPVDAPSPKGKAAASGRSEPEAKSIEIKLVAIEGDSATLEVSGAEHTLEPGESFSVEN